jgi:signal transduction histidine kinase
VEPWRGLTPRRKALPALLAGAIALAGVGGFAVTRDALQHPGDREAEAAAMTAAAVVDAHLRADGALLAAASTSDVLARPYEGVDLNSDPAWRLAADLARDGGNTTAAASRRAGGGILEVRARYRDGSVPATVTERRQQLAGYVAVVQPGATVREWLTQTVGRSIAVRLVEGATPIASTSSWPSNWPAGAVHAANGGSWSIEAHPTPSHSRVPLLILFGSFIVAAGIGSAFAASQRSAASEANEAVARADELRLVARMGPLLQQSLDVAELLPLFVVEVSDQLALDDITLSLLSPNGQLSRAFTVGRTPVVAEPVAALLTGDRLASGARFALSLHRGGRVIGVLTATAKRGLEPSQVDALRAACDVLAAALGNAAVLQEEQDLVARLRDVDHLKATFLGAVSHELRTMVIAIEGFADLLVKQGPNLDEARRGDFLERIGRNARSLGVLVEDLLDFARLESSGISVSLRPTDLSEVVPKVVDQMASLLAERLVTVEVEPHVVAMADPAAIERILVNLLSNAAKYTPVGAEVSVSLRRDAEHASLVVSDNGPGVDPAERERIFELFYRVDNDAARAARGVGIGLALVRQLADLLHGTVTAEEAPSGGARFSLSIPLEEDTAAAAPPLATTTPRREVNVHAS